MFRLGLDKCSLLSVFVESVLWGVFVLLYSITLYLITRKGSKIVKYVPHLLSVTLMLGLCTMHIGLSFRRELDAFFLAPSPLVYLEDTTGWNSRFKTSVHIVQILMTDFLIITRSFFLWNKNYAIVILPCFFLAGTLAAGVWSLLVMGSPHPTSVMEAQLQLSMILTLVLTIATKITCLFLVAFRVRKIHDLITSRVDRHISVYTLMVVLVESGAAALVACIALLPMFVAKCNAHYIIGDALSPIMGITFTTIIAGITANLTNPTASVPLPRPAWNRYSAPPIARAPAPPTGSWKDFRETIEVTTPGLSSCDGPSRPPSFQASSQSIGSLDMPVVLR